MKRKTNPVMAWIDYQEVYDMISRSWVGECQEIFEKAKDVRMQQSVCKRGKWS